MIAVTAAARRPVGGASGTPPAVAVLGKVVEDLAGQAAQQMPLVLEVDVEAGPGDARLGRQPVHAELGEAGSVGHQAFGGVEQSAFDLLAPLLPLGLRLWLPRACRAA
jgi:hypothetical protein